MSIRAVLYCIVLYVLFCAVEPAFSCAGEAAGIRNRFVTLISCCTAQYSYIVVLLGTVRYIAMLDMLSGRWSKLPPSFLKVVTKRGGSDEPPIGHGNHFVRIFLEPLNTSCRTTYCVASRTIWATVRMTSWTDTLDEHARIVGSPKAQDLLRQVREELIPGSFEERISLQGYTEMMEMVD